MQLELLIGETGRVTSALARGFDADLDRCLQTGMSSWRFPIPHARDGRPTTAGFQLSATFAPG